MGMGRRIQQRLDDLGWGQVDLLSRIPEMSPATLSALILRDSSMSNWSAQIAEALGVSHRWLQDGEGPMANGPSSADVSAWVPTGRVPVVSWELVAGMDDASSFARALESSEDWAPTLKSPPKGAFAVRLDSDAMAAPSGSAMSFPRGTIMVVDPARRAAAGDVVIARDPTTGWPTCKRLVSDAGRWLLVPLNPAYPSAAIESVERAVLGVCCEWHSGGTL